MEWRKLGRQEFQKGSDPHLQMLQKPRKSRTKKESIGFGNQRTGLFEFS